MVPSAFSVVRKLQTHRHRVEGYCRHRVEAGGNVNEALLFTLSINELSKLGAVVCFQNDTITYLPPDRFN